METKSNLFEYGIAQEHSDIRAHVGVLARKVYVFRTRNGLSAIAEHKPTEKDAFQPGVNGRTASGYLLRVEWIKDIRIRDLSRWPVWEGYREDLDTSEKGRRAVDVVCAMLKRGVFPLWIEATEDDRRSIQISGADIVVFAKQKIQVKCDYRCGSGHPLCTGNLFIQRAERNPLHRV